MNPARRRFFRSATGVGGVLAASLARIGPSSAVPPTGRMRPDAHARPAAMTRPHGLGKGQGMAACPARPPFR